MPYYMNQINQNIVKGNVLQSNQIGTVNTSMSDVTKTVDNVSCCELLNSNSEMITGDTVDNSAGTNPVKAVIKDVTLQNSLHKLN